MLRLRWILLAAWTTLLDSPAGPAVNLDGVVAGAAPAVLEMDPRAMQGLESRGLSLAALLGARASRADALSEAPLYASLVLSLDADLAELEARPDIGPIPMPNHAFKRSWLHDPLVHFELVGAVNRLDRQFVTPAECGEARLVYRLIRQAPGRPSTPLPMTISVVLPQPGGDGSCTARAKAWTDLPRAGAARVDALAALFRGLPPFTKVEVNLQNLHGTAANPRLDDHAEYLLRSFERRGDVLEPIPLLDTPRTDLDEASRRELAQWVRAHFTEIDAGGWVLPEKYLATRAVSVTPRGFARTQNRPFATLFGDGAVFADLPYDEARLVKSPRGLLRRLDQGTCQGCHATRSIAGFHLLGESRDPDARLNALAVARSTHEHIELGWRSDLVASVARGRSVQEAYAAPRPFAERRAAGPGGLGAHCALDGDPTFAGWTCASGMRCRDDYHDPDAIGFCAPSDGNHLGDACQPARSEPTGTPGGDRITPETLEGCTIDADVVDACSPNWFGFPGGMCVAACGPVGGRSADGTVTCMEIPQAGFENECMAQPIPIEACLSKHVVPRGVRSCDAEHACRDDYACARAPGLPPDQGACVPPYFVFQARVDGPLLDR